MSTLSHPSIQFKNTGRSCSHVIFFIHGFSGGPYITLADAHYTSGIKKYVAIAMSGPAILATLPPKMS